MRNQVASMNQTQRLIVVLGVLLAGVVLIPFVPWPSEALRWQTLAGIYEPPAPTPTPVSVNVRVGPGWTLLGLPHGGIGPRRASELIGELTNGGFEPRQTVRWENGAWQSHLPGFSFNDFPIEPGRGYFVRSTGTGTWVPGPRLDATPVPPPASMTVPIQAGWTLLTLPRLDAGEYTAASLIAELVSQNVDVTQVVRWQDGQWESYRADLPGNDFPIEAGRAFFVKSTNYGTWTVEARTGSSTTPGTSIYQGPTQHAAATDLNVMASTQLDVPALMLGYSLSASPAIAGSSRIELVNPGASAAQVQVEFRDSDGVLVASRELGIAAGGRADLTLADTVNALPQGFVGAAAISSTQPVGAVVRESLQGLSGDSLGSFGVRPAATGFFVPSTFKAYYGYNSTLFLHNPSSAAATVSIQLTSSTGPIARTVPIPALGSTVVSLRSETTLANGIGRALVTSDQPIQVVHLQENDSSGNTAAMNGFPLVDGAQFLAAQQSVSARLYVSGLYKGVSFSTAGATGVSATSVGDITGLNSGLTVVNPSASAASVVVEFYDESGARADAATHNGIVSPGKAVMYYVPNVPGLTSGTRYAAVVTSDVEVFALANHTAGGLALSAESTGTGVYRAVAPVGLSAQGDAAFSLLNAGEAAAAVQVTYRDSAGLIRGSRAFSLPATGSTLIWLDETSFGSSFRGTVEVTSDQPVVGETLVFASNAMP